MQATRLEAAGAPQARSAAGARASAMIHSYARAVLYLRSTHISHGLHERGAKVSHREASSVHKRWDMQERRRWRGGGGLVTAGRTSA